MRSFSPVEWQRILIRTDDIIMKFLYLFKKRLVQYYLNNKGIFLLFILGGIINGLVFAYLYGNLLPAVNNRDSQQIYYREYTVRFQEHRNVNELLSSTEILNESSLLQSVVLCHQVEQHAIYPTLIFASVTDEPPVIRMKGNVVFSGTGQVIVPSNCPSTVGDLLDLPCGEFTVIGQHTGEEYYITCKDFQQKQLPVTNLYVVARDRQNFSDDAVAQVLQEMFPGDAIKTPKIWELSDRNASQEELTFMCLCFAVATVSFMFLLLYVLDSGMDENIVSMIVGASKTSLTVMIYWEGLLLSSTANALGLVLHWVLYEPIFSKINVSDSLVYSLRDYIVIFLMMFVITVVILAAFLGRYAKMSPIKARQTIL